MFTKQAEISFHLQLQLRMRFHLEQRPVIILSAIQIKYKRGCIMYVEANIYLELGNVYAAEIFCIIYLDMMHNIICEN